MKTHFLLAALTVCLAGLLTEGRGQGTCPSSIRNIGDCPVQGCGSGGDANLNRKKNRTSTPRDPEERSLGWIRQLNEPDTWVTGQSRSSIEETEARAVVVRAYISRAEGSGGETTNCNLPGDVNEDWHLDLVSTRNGVRATAVSAEITPRLRRAGWELRKLRRLARDRAYVRVTGWLMLDSFHITFRPLNRSTNWEIHPVTKFEVCTLTVARCRQGEGWVALEDFEL